MAELAGVLSVDGLKNIASEIRGKTIVCIISGKNFDLSKTREVYERAHEFYETKKYLSLSLPHVPDALIEALLLIKGKGVNITDLNFSSFARGGRAPCFIGLEGSADSLREVLEILGSNGISYEERTHDPVIKDIIH